MKKKFFLSMALACCMSWTAWAGKVQTVTINGEAVTATVCNITFDGDNVVLHFSDQSSQTADMNDVVISFSEGTATGIARLNAFTYNGVVGDMLRVANVAPGTRLAIYNTAGQKVAEREAVENDNLISLSGLPAGTYILHAGQQAVKFVKK